MSDSGKVRTAGEGWSLVRAGDREATGLEVPTIPAKLSTPAGDVRFAVGERGEARLLVPLHAADEAPAVIEAPSIRIGVSRFMIAGRYTRFLDLTCLESELETVFAEVADAIVKRIASGQRGVTAAISTIDDFRALLLRASRTSRQSGVIAGLVGELLVLNRLLERSPGAWSAWCGPLGDRHDFRARGHALEVKTTTKVGNTEITVSSIEQLAEPTNGTLHLLHLTVEPTSGGLLTVSALTRGATAKAAGRTDGIFDRLRALGCPDADAPEWNASAFRYEDERLFEVCGGFPRLTPAMLPQRSLPNGVSGVTYRLDLRAAARFRRDKEATTALEKELAGCP